MGTRNPDVDAWLDGYDNPMKPVVERVRAVMLDADDRIGEVIKWSTPTFVYMGNLASVQPRARQFVSILFHEGASIPGNHPLLEGDAGENIGDTETHVLFVELKAGAAHSAADVAVLGPTEG